MTREKWTIEIEFDTELSYSLETFDPGQHGYMGFKEDGIYGYDGLDFPWRVLKREKM